MSCPSGKIPYKNAQAASNQLQYFRRGGGRRAYKCSECHEWHLTHSPKKTKPAVKRRFLEREE